MGSDGLASPHLVWCFVDYVRRTAHCLMHNFVWIVLLLFLLFFTTVLSHALRDCEFTLLSSWTYPVLYFDKTIKNKLHSEGRDQPHHPIFVAWMQSKIRCNQPINATLFTTLLCVIAGLFFDVATLGDLCSIPAAVGFFFCFGAVMHRRHRPTDKFLMGSCACPPCLKWLADPRVHMFICEYCWHDNEWDV